MADIGASVLARLKNKAKETGRSNQLCVQLFCQEEFLRRLERSDYAENLVLKGGLFLYTLTGFDSRVTMDIDFLLRQLPNTPEQLKMILEEIISVSTGNEFITFEIKSVEPISLEKKYAGISVLIIAHIKNTRTPFKIDFGVGDIIIPGQEKRTLPTQLDDFSAPVVNTYSLETTVAEKLDAILDLMQLSSRMKDYYDLYYIASKFDFDGSVLVEAMRKTFANRGHLFTLVQFEEMLEFDQDPSMQKKWQQFIKKKKIEADDYSMVMHVIRTFLEKPYEAMWRNSKIPPSNIAALASFSDWSRF